MNRAFYLPHCRLCEDEILGVLLANNSLDLGEKIIPTDGYSHDPSTKILNKIGNRTPALFLSNPGIEKRMLNKTLGRVNRVLKISTMDYIHTSKFIKAIKGVL